MKTRLAAVTPSDASGHPRVLRKSWLSNDLGLNYVKDMRSHIILQVNTSYVSLVGVLQNGQAASLVGEIHQRYQAISAGDIQPAPLYLGHCICPRWLRKGYESDLSMSIAYIERSANEIRLG